MLHSDMSYLLQCFNQNWNQRLIIISKQPQLIITVFVTVNIDTLTWQCVINSSWSSIARSEILKN